MLALVLLSACAGSWRSVDLPRSGEFTPTTVLSLSSANVDILIHGVSVTSDSLFGFRLSDPLTCAECRRAWSLKRIDALKIHAVDTNKAGFSLGVVVGLVIMLGVVGG
jgi:hypothetical protein